MKMPRFEILAGFPSYGPPAIPCPAEWGLVGREGLVVAFMRDRHPTWVGNFRPGLSDESLALDHPDGLRVVVISGGACYLVHPAEPGPVDEFLCCVTRIHSYGESYVFELNHTAFVGFGADGVLWRTPALSWDGFRKVRIEGATLAGEAWYAPTDEWLPITVDLTTGMTTGGIAARPAWER